MYIVTHGKGNFLAKLCNKTYGIRSRKQRIESDRERDSAHDSYVRIQSVQSSQSSQVITRSSSENRPFYTLGEMARYKEAK